MKKLATVIALSFLSVPAFACPNMEHDDANAAPKTADKKDAPKKEEAPKPDTKQDAGKQTDAAKKDQKDTTKKPDKVSSK